MNQSGKIKLSLNWEWLTNGNEKGKSEYIEIESIKCTKTVYEMELTKEIKESIEKSVLCWLATVSEENIPNVSPKEIFNYFGTDKIIIANIASPQTISNIKQNENVCISFIEIMLQKGFQIKGKAEIITETDSEFLGMEKILLKMTEGKFPFKSITKISIVEVKTIIAPKYILYPETTEEEQIEGAKKVYGI